MNRFVAFALGATVAFCCVVAPAQSRSESAPWKTHFFLRGPCDDCLSGTSEALFDAKMHAAGDPDARIVFEVVTDSPLPRALVEPDLELDRMLKFLPGYGFQPGQAFFASSKASGEPSDGHIGVQIWILRKDDPLPEQFREMIPAERVRLASGNVSPADLAKQLAEHPNARVFLRGLYDRKVTPALEQNTEKLRKKLIAVGVAPERIEVFYKPSLAGIHSTERESRHPSVKVVEILP